MARTTLDIDTPILADLKRLKKQKRTSLGRIVSDLVAEAIGRPRAVSPRLHWIARSMKARVDITDKDAVLDVLES